MAQVANGRYDVAIVGGGPAGSTVGALLRKYNPALRVVILEKEIFPRDHVGESQLPPIGRVLHEMGAWDKIEGAGFPIKIGASYTWGQTTEPWEFEFLPLDEVRQDPRPAPYEGWRTRTAFQVDRAIYDDILLRHAAELGCEVHQGTRVARVHHENDRVLGLELEDGRRFEATHYVDASGNAATLRRALGVKVDAPTLLQNVAFWNYWRSPGLNADVRGHGVTRVQIRSVPFGWLWYIPLSETRASVGLVCPAQFYKASGQRPAELYARALAAEPRIARLLEGATPNPRVESTTDWSFVSERAFGPNWFLVGEALGFADPILAAGLTLTHTSARHLAYLILELERGAHDRDWLVSHYQALQGKRVRQHIRFAEYWYSANGCFSDIQDFCTSIARDAGLRLNPADAFRWLSNGGLDDEIGQVIIGGFNLAALKQVQWRLSGHSHQVTYQAAGKNHFKLNLAGATRTHVPVLRDGRIIRTEAYERAGKTLPLTSVYGLMVEALRHSPEADKILAYLRAHAAATGDPEYVVTQAILCLEAMVNDYWVIASFKRGRPTLDLSSPREGQFIYSERLGPGGRGTR